MDRDTRSYVDETGRLRDRATLFGFAAIIGTFGALVVSTQQAVKVYASTADKLLSLHNDLIRKGEREHAAVIRDMATKAEIEPLRADMERRQGSTMTTGRVVTALGIVATLAMTFGFGVAHLIWG